MMGGVASVHGDFMPAALDGPGKELHRKRGGVRLSDVSAGNLWKGEAAHLQYGAPSSQGGPQSTAAAPATLCSPMLRALPS